MRHLFERSLPYTSRKGCPPGYHKRSSYTIKNTNTYVPPRCIRSTTRYQESQKEFRDRLRRRATQRLMHSASARKSLLSTNNMNCPDGMIARKGYVRRFRSTVRREGYVQTRKGRQIQVYPVATSVYVKPGCIKNRGKTGKGVGSSETIAPLRKGELMKHGYSTSLPQSERHHALESALSEFGSLGVFRKLNAVAKLTSRTAPKSSHIFAKDRDWVRQHFSK